MTDTVLSSKDLDFGVAHVTLNQPDHGDVRGHAMIDALADIVAKLEEDDGVRAVVLMSAGHAFSDGYNRRWFRDHLPASRSQREADALAMLHILAAWNHLPKPVVARVHDNATSPGIRLVCVPDSVVALENGRFGFTGSRLGLAPSLVAPFIISRTPVSSSSLAASSFKRKNSRASRTAFCNPERELCACLICRNLGEVDDGIRNSLRIRRFVSVLYLKCWEMTVCE